MNNTISSLVLNSIPDQQFEVSKPSRIISLSLKRKHDINKVTDVKENLEKTPTSKRKVLSLKRNNKVSTKEVQQDQLTPKIKEKSSDPSHTESIDNTNAFIDKKGVEVVLSNKKTLENGQNSNIIQHTPDVLHNLGTIDNTGSTANAVEQIQSSLFSDDCICLSEKISLISVSSATEIGSDVESLDTIIYNKTPIPQSFDLTNCKDINVNTKKSSKRSILVSQVQNDTNVELMNACELIGHSQKSDVKSQEPDKSQDPDNSLQENQSQEPDNSQETDIHFQAPDVNSEMPDDITKTIPNTLNDQVVSVDTEIRKKNLSTSKDQSKVLVLKTNAIEKLSHVVVQPPSYKSFRRKIQGNSKISSGKKSKSAPRSAKKNGKVSVDGAKLNQIRIDALFRKTKVLNGINPVYKEKLSSELCNDVRNCENEVLGHDDMSRIARADTARSDGVGRLSRRVSKEENVLSRSKLSPMSHIRASNSEAPQFPSPRGKNESASSCSPRRRNVDTPQFNSPSRIKSSKTAVVPRDIPYYKIVAGTHFAVDAFCYGDIPGVKNYFLTHFHSDHYSGLKKNFNKSLFCTQITADLCTSRLGVSLKHIHVINIDETLRVDGVEVTAIDANHCPGAIMLLFTLPNGKTLLHTGDFRATPAMESHPAFWNCDIHTIYLDTTYCNPRYDFPTQDQSLEMALHILRQKKMALEKVGKKFTSVLIVCGTYTIGKEKFFLGLAKRVGCSVWACPEKDKVLQTVEKRSFSHASPQSCQLHVVPMRDLTHEKLRSYLDSLQGPFSEVVAFKPSGWENGKNTPTTKDSITVHGIPYSEHSSFSEMIRFVNFLKPKQVIPTVDISGGVKAVQKYFPCPLVYKEDMQGQTKLTDFFNVQNRQQISAVS